ncbi:hypothetical protein F4561_002645 [Lipingzhangella halophila]|uniref:Uncharacterized protein n=1 Tax=Lipingzhangella halophila TaxID=1783352 RepID=A0A7W7RH12_9ACTN|nr:hypothetical protein [Lipingzhangella halophila]MBB4931825.1 hypothetical protein [Lipingzhangella halophila]
MTRPTPPEEPDTVLTRAITVARNDPDARWRAVIPLLRGAATTADIVAPLMRAGEAPPGHQAWLLRTAYTIAYTLTGEEPSHE